MRLPRVLNRGMRGVVNIKMELDAINYGLRKDSVDIFNQNVLSISPLGDGE